MQYIIFLCFALTFKRFLWLQRIFEHEARLVTLLFAAADQNNAKS